MKLDILAFAAHPDDVELSCAGTLIKHIETGSKVGIIDLTRGELGTRGTPEIRAKEAAKASSILGIHIRENLQMEDGLFEISKDNKIKIVRMIRKYRPEFILANAPADRHPDHGRAAELTAQAAFLSGLQKLETYDGDQIQMPWRPRAVYHYIQDRQLVPDVVVNITGFIEKRLEAIRAYSSQFHNPDSIEPETAISSKQFMELLRTRSMEHGRLIGVEYGEGFIVHRPIGVELLSQLV